MQPGTPLASDHFVQLYAAFNQREIETLLSFMQPNVQWANGMEGGFVYGRDAVRQYWIKQFGVIRSQVQPLQVQQIDDGRQVVTVHQVVRDLEGNLLKDHTVQHIFTMQGGLIGVFEIGESGPAPA